MGDFSQYYVEFVQKFFSNLYELIKTIIQAIYKFFFTDVARYFDSLLNWSEKFNFWDWFAFVFVFLVNTALIVLIVLLFIVIEKRRRRLKKKKLDREELLEEIESLNYQIQNLVNEKNQIFAMKVSNIGLKTAKQIDVEDDEEETKDTKALVNSRFTKLKSVDEKYDYMMEICNMNPDDMLTLSQLVTRFVNFSASNLSLYYNKKVVATFFAGMATSKVMILEGISGTGKTSLPYAMGKFFGNDSSIVSVQPSWRDRAEIIGYLNEFTKKFNETDFLKALYETTYRDDLNFIVLDEMNLARIEYYFAEFLSIMEMPDYSEWKIDIVPDTQDSDPKNLVEGKILISQNVWFVGTANKDDSTFTITDKVYDRATVIEMNNRATYIDAPPTPGVTMSYEYLDSLFNKALTEFPITNKMLENIQKLDRFIADSFKVTFGNRIMKQIKTFVPIYVACGFGEVEAVDYFIAHKVLRKFESLNLSFLHKELEELIAFLDKSFGKNTFNECINYIKDLIKNS